MRYNHVLSIVARSLVNNGVRRDLILDACHAVIRENRDLAIEKATNRARCEADRDVNVLDDIVETVLVERQRDYPMLVNANAYVDHNNVVHSK